MSPGRNESYMLKRGHYSSTNILEQMSQKRITKNTEKKKKKKRRCNEQRFPIDNSQKKAARVLLASTKYFIRYQAPCILYTLPAVRTGRGDASVCGCLCKLTTSENNKKIGKAFVYISTYRVCSI